MRYILTALIVILVPVLSHGKTLDVLLEDFRKKTFELSGNQTTELLDSVIIPWINEGHDAVASLLEPLELRTAFISTAALMEVTMPSDFQSTRSAFAQGIGALAHVSPEKFGVVDTVKGTYYTHGQTFFCDVRNHTTTGDSIIVLYYGSVADMTIGADTAQVPKGLQRLIIDYAYSSYEMSRHRVQVALAIRAEVRAQLAESRAARRITRETE
ncbi:MAG: hypothetical protein ACE5GA_00190 [Candidatus Zixiibacteriota bacterium]